MNLEVSDMEFSMVVLSSLLFCCVLRAGLPDLLPISSLGRPSGGNEVLKYISNWFKYISILETSLCDYVLLKI